MKMKVLGMEVETGVYISLISETMFKSLWGAGTVLMHQETRLYTYIGAKLMGLDLCLLQRPRVSKR